MAGQGLGEPVQAGVDVLAAAFDEPIGVQDEGVTLGVGQIGLGAGDVFEAGAQWRVGGPVQQVAGAVGVQQDGGRWPALL
ncbi:hypothetical protein SAV14893_086530 [Streptomyces avermitilis]|uniref:Uncharacterized protein n=1 Tax=Streptomyces avermitilis TaxID=33903 RepID=A0A4D4MBE4_STRAX|nr:hypothetical protein SAV14893_086530 [Streptomyces avermitilis]